MTAPRSRPRSGEAGDVPSAPKRGTSAIRRVLFAMLLGVVVYGG